MSARNKLAAVVAAVAMADKASLISKEREYRRCLALALDLLGELVDKVDYICDGFCRANEDFRSDYKERFPDG